jgi:hypothetical protein
MARMRLLVVCTAVVCITAPPVAAATVLQWVSAVETSAMAEGVLTPGDVREQFNSAKATLSEANVMDEELVVFVNRYARPDMASVARLRQSRFDGDVSSAVRIVKQVFTLLPRTARDAEPLHGIALELMKAENDASMTWDRKVLSRMEKKYGPRSARLNGLEVLAAFALQRTPGFRVDPTTHYPGPFEPIIAYTATYLTRSDEKMRIISVAETGLRRYVFAESWGGSGLRRWLKPAYVSGGLAISGRTDDPLRSPFQGRSRFGAFVGWGDLKVAYLFGDDRRVLVTQQIQIIPLLF